MGRKELIVLFYTKKKKKKKDLICKSFSSLYCGMMRDRKKKRKTAL